jgi:hypothetical protein
MKHNAVVLRVNNFPSFQTFLATKYADSLAEFAPRGKQHIGPHEAEICEQVNKCKKTKNFVYIYIYIYMDLNIRLVLTFTKYYDRYFEYLIFYVNEV